MSNHRSFLPSIASRMKKVLLSLFTCAALIGTASADPVVFTFTATANATSQGYTFGNDYTFSFATGSSYATLSDLSQSTFADNSSFNGSNYWKNFSTSDSALFVSASGTGLGGTFVPSATNPGSYIANGSISSDFVVGTATVGQTVGMTTLSGTLISYFNASAMQFTLSPAAVFTGSYVDPTEYFGARPGVYAVTAFNPLRLYGIGAGGDELASFTVTQLEISGVSAVPEPSTYAAFAGIAMLGFAAWRRRRVQSLSVS